MRNWARCAKCLTIIESKFPEDYVHCECGAIAVTGGPGNLLRNGERRYVIELDPTAPPDPVVLKPLPTEEAVQAAVLDVRVMRALANEFKFPIQTIAKAFNMQIGEAVNIVDYVLFTEVQDLGPNALEWLRRETTIPELPKVVQKTTLIAMIRQARERFPRLVRGDAPPAATAVRPVTRVLPFTPPPAA